MKSPEKIEIQRRMRNTLRHFESILKPLHEMIRSHSSKVKEHSTKGELYISDLTSVDN